VQFNPQPNHFIMKRKMGRSRNDGKQEMPSVSSLRDKASKIGHLKKLSGKGILTSGTWRDRFCLLVKNKLYYYESEVSKKVQKTDIQ